MAEFRRYGIYLVPDGDLFEMASSWLGWDCIQGKRVPHPHIGGVNVPIEPLTRRPRKYGIHGTMKAPFTIAEGKGADSLKQACDEFCSRHAAVSIPELAVRPLGRFVAIVPSGPNHKLAELASSCVQDLDPFRAPPTQAELIKRRKARLSANQQKMLNQWGYPYVLDEFQFHMTLTGPTDDAEDLATVLSEHFSAVLAQRFNVASLCLMGEDEDGFFHMIHRSALSG